MLSSAEGCVYLLACCIQLHRLHFLAGEPETNRVFKSGSQAHSHNILQKSRNKIKEWKLICKFLEYYA